MDKDNQMQYEGEDYADLIEFYLNNPQRLNKYSAAAINYMNEVYAIVHVPVSQASQTMINTFGYSTIPKLYGLTSEANVAASGVTRLRALPRFDLRGNGVVVAIIDTGIDYTNPAFIKADGTTKIISIWDQTLNTGSVPYNYPFGTEYNSVQINNALTSANPYNIVPSTDEIGHGTMMAAVSAGNENPKENFAGVVPDADLIIVKLRQAKHYLRNFFVIPENVPCYQENHIMWGIQYCVQKSSEINRPIVICTGVGSSQGPHDGKTHLSTFLSIVGDFPRTAVIVPIGNEGARKRHYYGNINPSIGFDTVELTVGEKEGGFSMELWGNLPGIYSIDIISPTGEYIPKFTPKISDHKDIRFIFDSTIISIDYQIAEALTGEQFILMRFRNITPGIWKLNVYGQNNLSTGFHIWLPMGDMISENTYFTKPDIYTTLLDPGSSTIPITITAYDATNNSLYFQASRGYTRKDVIKPELAAPGVNYKAPNNNKEYLVYTGTGVATAHTAGIAAMILEWGVVNENRPDIDTSEIKNYLIRGANRRNNLVYPNKDWGYGIINIFDTYNVFRTDFAK